MVKQVACASIGGSRILEGHRSASLSWRMLLQTWGDRAQGQTNPEGGASSRPGLRLFRSGGRRHSPGSSQPTHPVRPPGLTSSRQCHWLWAATSMLPTGPLRSYPTGVGLSSSCLSCPSLHASCSSLYAPYCFPPFFLCCSGES